MERIKLIASEREETGKNRLKKVRKADYVPACVYKGGKEATNIKVNKKLLYAVLHTKAGENVIIDMTIEGKSQKARPVMVKEVQYHPIKDEILHVDFNEISLTDRIKVNVPVVSKGTADAVVREKGTLEHIMWELEVECLPTAIPEKIEVDVSQVKIGDKIFVKNLVAPEGVRILNDPELIVMSGEPPHIEKPAEEMPAEEGAVEPEVIKKEKKAEEEAEEEEAPPKEEKKGKE